MKIQYLLYLPPGYKKAKGDWPTIVFLHGAAERGTDLARVTTHGPPKLVEQGKVLPFVVIAPQCPASLYWDSDWLSPFLDRVCREVRVALERLYLTGISMGGYGVWQWACAEPERFAAIAPICGGADTRKLDAIRDLPVWVFHGAKDDIVPVSESQRMVDALRALGGNVKLTIYRDAGHDCWTQTYNDPDLFRWFVAHRRHEPVTA